jgi:sulfoquinovose isomerase
VRAGWAADGRPGFVYTVDWDRRPVVAERLHWVVCEAVGAAAALGAPELTDWWSYARDAFVTSDGSWRHELDPAGRPSATVWAGRPDVYHAFQAILLTREPLDSTLLPPR